MTEIVTDIFNYTSKEFYSNLSPKDIPPRGHRDREAFIENEERKCFEGVTVNGVFIPPTLYWTLNHWVIQMDSKDKFGNPIKSGAPPDLRDNDWIIHNALWEAEQDEKKGLVLGTARQVGKSANTAAVFGRDLALIPNCQNLLIAGNAKYLTPILQYLDFGLSHCTEFFRIPRLTKSKGKDIIKIEYGFKTPQNDDVVRSVLHIRNTQDGAKTEISAGLTLNRVGYDEIATHPFKSAYETVRPALIGKFGRRSSSILSFTGGDVEKSKNAEELYMNPEAANFKAFKVEGEEKERYGCFIPGKYRQDLKKQVNLADWLGVPNVGELSTIKINVVDEEKATKTLEQEELTAKMSEDPTAYVKHKMYNPTVVGDMFLQVAKNPFPIEGLMRHMEWLKDNPQGVPVELYEDVTTGLVKQRLSDKVPIPKYPLVKEDKYISKDAPIMIYDSPKHTEHYQLHIIGGDFYNDNQTIISDSLGAVYVMRRNHTDIADPYQNCIVASYVARPSTTKEFYENVRLLRAYYNATILHENSGNSGFQFFDSLNLGWAFFPTFSLQREINPNSKVQASVGLKANQTNHNHQIECALAYLNEELDEETGLKGLTRIPDPMLCQELIMYDGFGPKARNTDRVDAFLLAVTLLFALRKLKPVTVLDGVEDDASRRVVGNRLKTVLGSVPRSDQRKFLI